VVTCRNYASELAISEVTQRTFNELQQLLEGGTRTLLDALRGNQRRRTGVPPVAGRRRGALLRQNLRPGIRLGADQAAEVASHDQKAAARA